MSTPAVEKIISDAVKALPECFEGYAPRIGNFHAEGVDDIVRKAVRQTFELAGRNYLVNQEGAAQAVEVAQEENARLRSELEACKKELSAVRICFAEASHNAGPAFVAHEELARVKKDLEEIKARGIYIATDDNLRTSLEFAQSERDAAQAREIELAAKLGETQAKLEGSNWPVIEQWKERAEKAEKERDESVSQRNEWRCSALLYHSELRDLAAGKKVETQLGYHVEQRIKDINAEREKLRADCAALREGLEKAKRTFVHYAFIHKSKLPPDAAKAAANQSEADFIAALLSTPNPGAALLEELTKLRTQCQS